MATIRKRVGKTGVTYQAQVRVNGAPLLSATFRRRTDAKLWADATEEAIKQKVEQWPPQQPAQEYTLGQLIDRYLDGPVHQYATCRAKTLILRWWEKQLGRETRLTAITPAQIVEAREYLEQGGTPSGKLPSASTVLKYLTVLSSVFTFAVKEWFWLKPHQNPFLRVKAPPKPRGRVRFLSNDERKRLFAACKNSKDKRLFPLVITAIASGARQGELMALRWSDIDFNRGSAILEHTKNGDRRSVPISRSALKALRALGKVRKLKSDHVFESRRGNIVFPYDPWWAAVKEAGLEDFTFHDLRHTAASYLAMSGATLAEIAEILGHRTLQMVKRYAHLTEQHSHRVASRMADHYLAEVGPLGQPRPESSSADHRGQIPFENSKNGPRIDRASRL